MGVVLRGRRIAMIRRSTTVASRSQTRRWHGALLCALLCAELVGGWPAAAQVGAASVWGQVLDVDGQPIAGALVKVDRLIVNARSGVRGMFVLQMPQGEWTLQVRRIGFGEARRTIRVDGQGEWQAVATPADDVVQTVFDDTLRFSLQRLVTEMRAISVRAESDRPLAHVVTTETVRQVPALAEPDVFRAVQLLPGISQPNDLKGTLHLAGGASDETAVFLDGHPLQQPFHVQGLLGAFNVAALEKASIHIYDVPGEFAGTLAGVVELDARHISGRNSTEAVASVMAASVTTGRTWNATNGDLLLSGRMTYLDRVMERFAPNATVGGDILPIPRYRDLLARAGWTPGEGTRLELLAYRTDDSHHDPAYASAAQARAASWGEQLLGMRLGRAGSVWDLGARASVGDGWVHAGDEAPPHVEVSQRIVSTGMSAARPVGRGRAALSTSLEHRSNKLRWNGRSLASNLFGPEFPDEIDMGQGLDIISLTGEYAQPLGAAAQLRLRARTERSRGKLLVLPSAVFTLESGTRWRASIAASRRSQWTAQALEPKEGAVSQPMFLLDEPRTSLLLAASLEHRWARGLAAHVISITPYARSEHGQPALDTTPNQQATPFPRFLRQHARVGGVALLGRRLWSNGIAVQAAYTWQRAFVTGPMGGQPSDWDMPHSVTFFGTAPLTHAWAVSTTLQLRSGTPVTPVAARVLEPNVFTDGSYLPRYILGAPNSGRLEGYRRLDVAVQRRWWWIGAEWTARASLLNASGRSNPLSYGWYGFFCRESGRCSSAADRTSLPLVPSVGIEARW